MASRDGSKEEQAHVMRLARSTLRLNGVPLKGSGALGSAACVKPRRIHGVTHAVGWDGRLVQGISAMR